MKKKIYSTLLISALMMLPLFSISQMRDPGSPGGDPSGGGGGVGNSAPIGSGIGILIVLGAAYGGKKLYHLYQEDGETLEE